MKVGRKKSENTILAEKYGVSRKSILCLGGFKRLASMSEDARTILLNMTRRTARAA